MRFRGADSASAHLMAAALSVALATALAVSIVTASLVSGALPARATAGPAALAPDTAYAIVGSFPGCDAPSGIAVVGAGSGSVVDDTVYAVCRRDRTIDVYAPGATSGDAIGSLAVGRVVADIAFGTDGRGFVTAIADDSVGVLSPGQVTGVPSSWITTGAGPGHIVATPDDTIVTANETAGTLSLIAPGQVTGAAVDAPGYPQPTNIAAAGDRVYVTAGNDDSLIVGDAATGAILDTVTVPVPVAVAVRDIAAPGRDIAYVLSATGELRALDADTLATLDTTTIRIGNFANLRIAPDGRILAYSTGISGSPGSGELVVIGPDLEVLQYVGVTEPVLFPAAGLAVNDAGVAYVGDDPANAVRAIAELRGSLDGVAVDDEVVAGDVIGVTVEPTVAGVAYDTDAVVGVTVGGVAAAVGDRGGNTFSVTLPPGSGTVPVSVSLRGGGVLVAGTVTYAPLPAGPPTQVAAEPGKRSFTITWEPPTEPGAFPITDYEVVLNSTAGTTGCVTDALDRRCEFTRLAAGSTYTIEVRALTGAGFGAWSAPLTATALNVRLRGVLRMQDRKAAVVRIRGRAPGIAPGTDLAIRLKRGSKPYREMRRPAVVTEAGTVRWKYSMKRATRVRVTALLIVDDRTVLRSNIVRLRPPRR